MLPSTSFAMVQTARRTLEGREIPIPAVRDDDAILEVEACGICGSDYEQFEGELPAPLPVIPGHEPLGRIAAIGDAAAERWQVDVGDRVAVETLLACQACAECLAGRYQRCPRLRVYSLISLDDSPGLWGAYAQYMYLAPTSILHRVDPALPTSIAALFNPLAAGFRWSVEVPETRPGDSVLIMGPGQRGLASVVACKQAGAGPILVSGLAADAAKLEVARGFGADVTIDVENEDLHERVREATGGRGPDVVVDVSPYATQPILDAISLVRRGGTIVLAGIKGTNQVNGLASDQIVGKEITIKGATGSTSSGYRSAIETIESRRMELAPMHTHDFALEDAERAIRTLAREIPGEESIHSCLLPEH
ncbi:MAG: alcohol dehydrogenase catalytic domain-containing protein [bacterium]|nr:alcohol dehydrogenase catalytic domain-containing protein [bacterium]